MRRPAGQKTAVAGALVLPLLLGFALRALFIAHHPRFAGDALVYGELAHNVLTHHVYGLYTGSHLYSTLIRLPGYPLFLALCFKVFGDANYLAVVWVQAVTDLVTCVLIAALARRVAGEHVGRWALWLSALCPFTANYVAVPIAETCSFFCVALAFWGLQRWCDARRCERCTGANIAHPRRGLRWAVVIGLALAWAVLLRPEQGLLALAVVPVMLWAGMRSGGGSAARRIAPALVAPLIVALPLSAWTVRNWRVFHVVQPLAPKYANDPGEAVTYGFNRWFRTWAVGYPATVNVYWQYDGDPMNMRDLPARAFDSPQQRAQTAEIYAKYNQEDASTQAVDQMFAKLAAERVRNHPFRYYVELPVARELDMWLRPRIELLRIPLDWWRIRAHPAKSLLAYGFGALNVVYLVLAMIGVPRWRRARRVSFRSPDCQPANASGRLARPGAVGWAMGLFVAFRCALLLTIDNSEPRYVLECYPVVILLAAVAVGMRRGESAPGDS